MSDEKAVERSASTDRNKSLIEPGYRKVRVNPMPEGSLTYARVLLRQPERDDQERMGHRRYDI
jgi:hypothetical protein